MFAFGPVLDSEDEAAAFLDYIAAKDGRDPRNLYVAELDTLLAAFREEQGEDD